MDNIARDLLREWVDACSVEKGGCTRDGLLAMPVAELLTKTKEYLEDKDHEIGRGPTVGGGETPLGQEG